MKQTQHKPTESVPIHPLTVSAIALLRHQFPDWSFRPYGERHAFQMGGLPCPIACFPPDWMPTRAEWQWAMRDFGYVAQSVCGPFFTVLPETGGGR